jgi:amino acid permease
MVEGLKRSLMREFLNVLRVLIAVDVGIVVFCYLEDNTIWLYNTQVAFFSVSLIILGSFIGYSNMVKAELKNGNVGEDVLKKYEDPYNMDDEEDEIKSDELKKELNKKLKWYEAILFYFKGGFNLIRIAGYIFLVVGFIWLNKLNVFDYLSFLFGVSIVPAVALIYLYVAKKNYKNQE